MTSLGCRQFRLKVSAGLVRAPIGTPVRWALDGRSMGLIGSHPPPSETRFDGLLCLMGVDGAGWAILAEADGGDMGRETRCGWVAAW